MRDLDELFAAAAAERKRQRRSDRWDAVMWIVLAAAGVMLLVQAIVTLGGAQ